MELVLLTVIAVVCFFMAGHIVFGYRYREVRRESLLDLRCQNVIHEFQRRKS